MFKLRDSENMKKEKKNENYVLAEIRSDIMSIRSTSNGVFF
jgi:hypothetical protein